MNISKAIILDLLPLYLAGEASPDTQKLVEEFLATDQELKQLVAQTQTQPEILPTLEPILMTPEEKMKQFAQTKQMMFAQSFCLALAIFTTLSSVAFTFNETTIQWVWHNNPAGGAIFLGLGLLGWFSYGWLTYKLQQ